MLIDPYIVKMYDERVGWDDGRVGARGGLVGGGVHADDVGDGRLQNLQEEKQVTDTNHTTTATPQTTTRRTTPLTYRRPVRLSDSKSTFL